VKNSPESLDKQIQELRIKIEPLRKELASLVKSKKNLLSRMAAEKSRVKWNSDLKVFKQQLLLAYKGLSSTQIAAKLGCSKHNASCRIKYAWQEFYPNHFKNSGWLISCYGIIQALRLSEQPFTCPLRDEPYVPESEIEEYEWQKSLHQWTPLSERLPTDEDGDDFALSNDGIHIHRRCGLSNVKDVSSLFWRKWIHQRMPLYWDSRYRNW
jgi:hypothetical protein